MPPCLAADPQDLAIDRARAGLAEPGDGLGDVLWHAALAQRTQASSGFAQAHGHGGGHVGFDKAWGHGIDAGALLGQLGCPGLGEADQAGLARCVIDCPRLPPMPLTEASRVMRAPS